MDVEARSEATVKPFTATVEECIRVRSGIMRCGLERSREGDVIQMQAWVEMLEIACRLVDEAQAQAQAR